VSSKVSSGVSSKVSSRVSSKEDTLPILFIYRKLYSLPVEGVDFENFVLANSSILR
jgi:hypothetical protein